MNQELNAIIGHLAADRGIPSSQITNAIKNALLAAAQKNVGLEVPLEVEMDPKTSKMRVLASVTVVDRVTKDSKEISLLRARETKPDAQPGEVIQVEVTPKDFSRIATRAFKQAMSGDLRDIGREMIYNEFKDRADTLLTVTVRRFERSDVILDVGRFEGVMPARERVPTEEYTPGERLRAYVVSITNTPRGPEMILSRAHPNFVVKLFESEVNELSDGTIEVKAMAREAGYRTKLAVDSTNKKVDPVGALVGMKGARIKNVVRELNNEKVDVFRWSPNIKELVVEALKPAKLKNVEVDEASHRIKVTVDKENLSLAIGRRGQNARLASKITGWEIDVEEEATTAMGFEEKLTKAIQSLATALSVEPSVTEQIVRAGFLNIESIMEVDDEDFAAALPEMPAEQREAIRRAAVEKANKAAEAPASD